MNINRNNYESYFLLYVDNELSAYEKEGVEAFVAEHPDLEAEFKQFTELLLLPDEEITFEHKNELLKHNGSPIEEKLLLLLDNELMPADAKELRAFIEYNPALASDWNLLQQTKLDTSEFVIFKEKELLYRKERSRVISGNFARWAVAAALIAAGFFTAVKLTSDNPTRNEGSTASVTESTKSSKGQAAIIKKNEAAPAAANKQEVTERDANKQATPQMSIASEQNINVKEKTRDNTGTEKSMGNKPAPALAVTEQKLSTPPPASLKTIEAVSPERKPEELAFIAPKDKLPVTDVNILTIEKNSLAGTASLANESSDNRILYFNEDAVTHSKAAGFFRKIKRTVERKTKISTGNSLKIAGFEIALN